MFFIVLTIFNFRTRNVLKYQILIRSTCEAKALEPLPPAIHPAFLAALVGLPLPLPQSGSQVNARLCHRELHSGTNKSGCNCRNQVPWALINSSSTLHRLRACYQLAFLPFISYRNFGLLFENSLSLQKTISSAWGVHRCPGIRCPALHPLLHRDLQAGHGRTGLNRDQRTTVSGKLSRLVSYFWEGVHYSCPKNNEKLCSWVTEDKIAI